LKLIRLTYFSRNQLDLFNAPMADRVAEIVDASAENNGRDALGSMLIYDSKWFAQVIEGNERTIIRRFGRMIRDPRHGDVSLVAMTPIAARGVPDLPMVAVAHDVCNADLFHRYGGSPRFDPQAMSADGLAHLIEAVAARHLAGSRPHASERGLLRTA
jgi:hypothetical protein